MPLRLLSLEMLFGFIKRHHPIKSANQVASFAALFQPPPPPPPRVTRDTE
jgi:hypothetical protein